MWQVKEREEEYLAAINMYMKAGLPARAARVATSRDVGFYIYFSSWTRIDGIHSKSTYIFKNKLMLINIRMELYVMIYDNNGIGIK